jgi:prepilin-type processing-associated H-X9-DG protein
VDVLFDEGYLDDWKAGICPVDERPDEISEIRGADWRFWFVREMGVDDEPRRGVRTSFGLNGVMNYNNLRDRYPDASRQVYAMDGWWTWFGDLNAYWLASGGEGDPTYTPHYEGTMVAWRHTMEYTANALMCDGHVARIVPNLAGFVQGDPINNPDRTVDTTRHFTWLPGERTTRNLWDYYQGEIAEYQGQYPAFTENPVDETGYFNFPHAYPLEDLCARYKTWRWAVEGKNWWHKLPNRPGSRR